MKSLFCVLALFLVVPSLAGCGGGSSEATVAQPSDEGGLSQADQQGYEQAMKEQSKKAGPGN